MSEIPPDDRPDSGDHPPVPDSRPTPVRKPPEKGRRPASGTPVVPRFAPGDDRPARSPDTGRQSMPHTPVRPRFADAPASPEGPARRAATRGCVLPALGLGVIALALIALALFLPPVSLWDRIDERLNDEDEPAVVRVGNLTFLPLTPESPRVDVDGLTVAVDPLALTAPFSVHILAVPPAAYLAGNTPAAADGWYCETDLPEHHALASAVYSLAQNGVAPGRFTLEVEPSPDARATPDDLELHVWNATSGQWDFWPSQVTDGGVLTADLDYLPRCVAVLREAESLRRVGVTLAVTDHFSADMVAGTLRVYPGSLRPIATGALDVVLAPGFETGQGYDVLPLIQNFDDPMVIDIATVQRILSSPALRTEHARQIAAFILGTEGYAGVVIDYRALPVELRDSYTAFVRDLAGLLHTGDRLLTVVLPAPVFDSESAGWITNGYDWQALGRYADEIAVMMPLDPLAYVPGAAVDTLLDWATTQVSRGKLLLGLEALSVEDQGQGVTAPVSLDDVLGYLDVQIDSQDPAAPGQTITAQLFSPGVQPGFGRDADAHTAYVRYTLPDGPALRTMWLTDPAALSFRIERAAAQNLHGVFVRDAMASGVLPGLETALLAYRLDQPSAGATFDPQVTWTVLAGGSVLADAAVAPEVLFVFDVPADVPALVIEARIAGRLVGRQTVTVAAPEPTALPTPAEIPDPTVTPSPEATLALDEPAATPTAAPTGAAPVTETPAAVASLLDQPIPTVDPALLAGADVGSDFETGVVMARLDRTLLEVGRAHLGWVKLELTYRLGATPAAQQQTIEQAQANGLKILLSVTGDPAEFAAIDRTDYIAEFLTYIGGLASYGVDGIEIWRGANDTMPADDYMQILGRAYHAIKTANPSTLVITGALTPAESMETPDQDDAAYVERLAEAGAAGYADCVGVQYTLGTVPPATASGDLRGDNPIYYLPGVTDRAWDAFGGALPVCFTRLGYLSAEGYPSLPADAAWAQATTAAQQAGWLADAVRLSAEGGQVRLLVIWALSADVVEDGSPQAGYAIIRPDGSCPACVLLEPLLAPPG